MIDHSPKISHRITWEEGDFNHRAREHTLPPRFETGTMLTTKNKDAYYLVTSSGDYSFTVLNEDGDLQTMYRMFNSLVEFDHNE